LCVFPVKHSALFYGVAGMGARGKGRAKPAASIDQGIEPLTIDTPQVARGIWPQCWRVLAGFSADMRSGLSALRAFALHL